MLQISSIVKIINQEVLRRVQLKKACLLADIRKKKMGYFGHIIRHSTLQHALLEGKIEDRCSRGKPITMWKGEHNRVVRIGLCGGNNAYM